MEEWKADMDKMREEIPEMQDKVEELQKTIAYERRRTSAYVTYNQADENNNVSGLSILKRRYF